MHVVLAYLCGAVFCWPVLCAAWWSIMASLEKLHPVANVTLSGTPVKSDLCVRCCLVYPGRNDEPGRYTSLIKTLCVRCCHGGERKHADNRTWRSLDTSLSGRGICVNGNTIVETRKLFPPKRVSQRMRITFSHPVQSKLTDSVYSRYLTVHILPSTVISQIY